MQWNMSGPLMGILIYITLNVSSPLTSAELYPRSQTYIDHIQASTTSKSSRVVRTKPFSSESRQGTGVRGGRIHRRSQNVPRVGRAFQPSNFKSIAPGSSWEGLLRRPEGKHLVLVVNQ
ncbi:hypothetical protein BDV39DRAFT_186967 [Aspergillus sergii]|uniref:Secreted protein n=1 Tax=Aspergillus sergii TaxID=1034303 RepID=A0A5N6WJ30_9EURO|nr:hypothetical protein BDV39DRAFT_186967 [Aspergillus sergii]